MTQTNATRCVLTSACKETAEASPFVVEFFMVQGGDFRCMAYRDKEGRWHKAFNHVLLPGEIRILE